MDMENNTVSRHDQALDDIAEMAGILGRAPRSVTLGELRDNFDTEVTEADLTDMRNAIRDGLRCEQCGYSGQTHGPISNGLCDTCNYYAKEDK